MKAELPLRLAAHLEKAVHKGRRRYRKRLAVCKKKFSEEAVHDLRIETRRLLALLDLLDALGRSDSTRKLHHPLKKRLKCFGELRDTQVQLQLLQPLWPKFPDAQIAKNFLEHREKRLATKLKREVKALKFAGLNRKLKAIEKSLAHCGTADGSAARIAAEVLSRTFVALEKLRRQVRREDTATLHQFRIGVKRFRYLCELLQPLLPRITDAQLERLREFQNAAGAIQDLEVLLRCFALAVKHRRLNPVAIRNLRAELAERKARAIHGFMARLDEVSRFKAIFESNPVRVKPAVPKRSKRSVRNKAVPTQPRKYPRP